MCDAGKGLGVDTVMHVGITRRLMQPHTRRFDRTGRMQMWGNVGACMYAHMAGLDRGNQSKTHLRDHEWPACSASAVHLVPAVFPRPAGCTPAGPITSSSWSPYPRRRPPETGACAASLGCRPKTVAHICHMVNRCVHYQPGPSSEHCNRIYFLLHATMNAVTAWVKVYTYL